ncbi:MAG: M14 family zinc carboxypeptidase [Acidobacteriota bacterium]|nr:M14 family zinc carboxypeptidase [Acidobacteriota bacterium]
MRRTILTRLLPVGVPILASLAGLVLVTDASAAGRFTPRPVDAEGRAQYSTVRLIDPSPEQVRRLVLIGFDIEGRSPGRLVAHVTLEELAKLGALGVGWAEFDEGALPHPGDDPTDAPASYHTYDTMTAELQQVALDHPSITRLVSAGPSVQGRELWWMLITDNPDVEEDEPGFKYIATMHGDEKVGTENCMQLINLLTDSYGADQRLTDLVDEVEIWIMPLMNPDGHTLAQRYNASGADLNRDFPDRIDDPVNTPDGRQPETQHVMSWQTQHSTSLSANFHGGAVVTNFPYDNNDSKQSVYTATPDDDIIVDVSIEYSEDNLPMYNGAWPQGITNGADWYVVAGGMQDWNYDYHGDVETTIELSNVKTPPARDLDSFWSDNQESMVSYMERALTGVRGVVTDAETSAPLAAALEIVGRDVPFYTDPEVGDYHRIMPAGSFNLFVSAPGYQSQTVPFTVSDPEANAVKVDVALQVSSTNLERLVWRVDQDSGVDGYLDPGENGQLAVTLENDGQGATGISGQLVSLTPHATPTSGATWPPLDPGAQAESMSPHLGLDVAPGTPPGHKLGFALDWQTAEGPEGTTSAFFVPVGAPTTRQDPAAGLPLPISDLTTIESTLTVAEDEELSEINVRVDITHTYIGDLTVTLVAPDGTEVRLHDQAGGSANDINTWFDTDTVPADSLDVLLGSSSQGSWKLRVTDSGSGDTGTLDGWTLERHSRVWEDPVAEVLLRDLTSLPGGDVRLDWWPAGSAGSYRVYRASDPSSSVSFSDVTAMDGDASDTTFDDTSGGSIVYWIVTAEGHTGEGLWGHFGQ